MANLDEQLAEAMASKPPEHIRNICLIAHVDHGKTSYADSLVSSNAIISARMAGKLRYLDNREDEQIRGITMKSSGISLLCDPMLVNLMDSPGHVDFSGEVTSALLLSDVALLLVDIIEGICSQTEALLRQAITNGQTIILVINKLDRLRIEFKMTPAETYSFIQRLLEAVNSCVSQIISGLVLEDDTWGNLEKFEHEMHFDPAKGNVIFSSAVHAYAFSMEEFAEIYAPKLKLDKSELATALFGDFYLHAGKITPEAISKGKKTLFEQLVLEPLWTLHDCGLVTEDLAKLNELAAKLGLKIKSRRVNEAFDETMRAWLPLPKATFRAIARAPSAKAAFTRYHRIEHLIGKRDSHALKQMICDCSPEGATLLFVAKFIQIDDKKLAIVRMLSGRIKAEDQLYVLGKMRQDLPEDDSSEPKDQMSRLRKTTIKGVYMLRGREANHLEAVTAGVICAIEADGLILNCTLCSQPCSEGLNLGRELGEPLVRVSISTKELERLAELKEALRNLVVLDPSLRVLELETGELAMVTAGEVHLQKCLKDLQDLGFEDLEVSSPIVPFLETVIPDPALTQQQIQDQITECRVKNEVLFIRLRIVPLPIEIVNLLEKNSELVRQHRKNQVEDDSWAEFKSKLTAACQAHLPKLKGSWWYKKTREELDDLIERIWSFGPDRARATILFNAMPDYKRKSIWQKNAAREFRLFDQAVVAGFELFANAGPLCNEVMRGVGVIVEEWSVADETDSTIGGQLMSAMKATCMAAAQKLALRLVAAMYKCTVATSSQALGKVHGVLAQRKAKVLSEDINEATNLFEVIALLPVVESFSFCEQLRKSTSGLASAQLHFSHWDVIDEDPYWTPSTLEEIEEFGMKGDSPNHARGYMDAVRRRKGLPTQDLIVISAEKQRNLKKNK